MPRYVILEHTMPAGDRPRHWDLMFEQNGSLKTWAVEEPPAAGQEQAAVPLPDHRLHYLTYEGPVSGDRGAVVRWDSGEYQTLDQSDSQWRMRLRGRQLQTQLTLRQDADQRWWVTFEVREAVESQ